MSDEPKSPEGQPGAIQAALLGLCPRCGAKTLFGGIAHFAPRCSACDLDYSKFNVGDGPAAFLTMIIGGLLVGLAVWLEFAVSPPWWVHALLWIPLLFACVIGGLRVSKAALLQAEYWRGAREAKGSDVGNAGDEGAA